MPNPPIVGYCYASAVITSGSMMLPANCIIDKIFVRNTTSNAVTGGIAFGTADNSGNIVSALTVGASAYAVTTDAAVLTKYFASATATQIFYDANSSWNSANVDIEIIYYQL